MKVVRHCLRILTILLFIGSPWADTATLIIDPSESGPEKQLGWYDNFPEQITET